MIILDTDLLAPQFRAHAWIAARAEAEVPSTVELRDPDRFRGRFERWPLREVSVSRHTVNSGQRLFRTPQQIQVNSPSMLSISLQEQGTGLHEQFGVQRLIPPGRLVCTDLTAPWEYSFAEAGSAKALLVDLAALDIPPDTVRKAAERLEYSPLHEFVTRHIADVFDQLTADSVPDGVADLAAGSVGLVRALLLSASPQPHSEATQRDLRAVMSQIKLFVERDLADPGLNRARIAAGVGMSVCGLDKVCAQAQMVLDDWITGRRMQRINDDLEFWGNTLSATTIAARWGFTDPIPFRRRYVRLYGREPEDAPRAV